MLRQFGQPIASQSIQTFFETDQLGAPAANVAAIWNRRRF